MQCHPSPLAFLSTPSARRATVYNARTDTVILISIHALREEGDDDCGGDPFTVCDFYPRPPRGGRRGKYKDMIAARIFLSTPSARRAT